MRSSRPSVIELFAGAGLFSLAFKQVGFQITRAIEINQIAASTYQKNLGNHIEVADVTRVKPEGQCDVLIAGPPCQGFSTLGNRHANDPRNRLSFQVLKWVQVIRPKVVVIENVAVFLESLASIWF